VGVVTKYLNYKTANINVKTSKSLSQIVRVFVINDTYKTANMIGAFSPCCDELLYCNNNVIISYRPNGT
jgi:hypothetical protein